MQNYLNHKHLLQYLEDWNAGLFTVTMQEYNALPAHIHAGMSYYRKMQPRGG